MNWSGCYHTGRANFGLSKLTTESSHDQSDEVPRHPSLHVARGFTRSFHYSQSLEARGEERDGEVQERELLIQLVSMYLEKNHNIM